MKAKEKIRFFLVKHEKNRRKQFRLLALLFSALMLFGAFPYLPDSAAPAYAASESDLYRIGLVFGSGAEMTYAFSAPGGMELGENTKSTNSFNPLGEFPAGSYQIGIDGSALTLTNESGETLFRYEKKIDGVFLAAKPKSASDGSAELRAKDLNYEGIFEFHIQDASLGGGVAVTNILPLNRYVMCVMSREIYGSWEVEMQKVFSVAVRTYAVSRKGFHDKKYGFDLCCKTCCQSYKGNDLLTENIIAGAGMTAGEIITYNGKPANINYSAVSGGVMVKSSDAWGGTDYAYLDAYPTPWENYGRHAPYTQKGKWTKEYTGQALYERLKDSYPSLKGEIADVHIDSYGTNSAYVTRITVTDIYGNTATVDRSDHVRIAFGLDSACFVVGKAGSTVSRRVFELDCFPRSLAGTKPPAGEALPDVLNGKIVQSEETVTLEGSEGAFVFDGSGWGHGVGLAQYGAWDMVKYGYDYRTVLAYYFRSSEITSIGVSEPKRGDVSGDGVINADDRIILARCLAGWSGYTVNPTAGDVNGDGRVSGDDRLYLARALAGWAGYSLDKS